MDNSSKAPRNPRIVVLCGSSGSLRPLLEILSAVPWDSGHVYVVLVHRRGGSSAQLAYLLSRAIHLPVLQIMDGSELSADSVHVMPAGKNLTTDGDVFSLAPLSTLYGLPDVFDIFLRSLADSTGHRSVTIFLSGMAGDGSAALKNLRLAGSVIVAQSDASYPSMPEAAIATGHVNFIATAEDIGTLVSTMKN